MDFDVLFYQSAEGHCPVAEFLKDLRITDPKEHAAVLTGLERRQDWLKRES